jgi:hypothetical protein
MEKKEYEPPIVITGEGGSIHIAYDQIEVEIPRTGPVPVGTPPLARRIFEAFTCDLPGHLRAE